MSVTIDISKLKVPELKQHLQSRGLETKGKKEELVARLVATLASDSASTITTTTTTTASSQPVQAPAPAPIKAAASSAPATTATAIHSTTTTAPKSSPTPLAPKVASQPTAIPQDNAAPAHSAPLTEVEGEEIGEEELLDISQMSDAERKKARAERFGIALQESESEKKRQRAARFGLPVSGLSHSGGLTKSGEIKVPLDNKLEERKKRFGITEDSNDAKNGGKASSVSKAQRLGLPVKAASINLPPNNDESKLKARQARFGTPTTTSGGAKAPTTEDQEKKRKRAERFAGTAAGAEAKRLRVDKPLEGQTSV